MSTVTKGLLTHAPKNPIHSGEILLEEFLKPSRVTQAAFAERIGWTRERLNEIIRGKRGVTATAALELVEALEISRKIGMNLQPMRDVDVEVKRRPSRGMRRDRPDGDPHL